MLSLTASSSGSSSLRTGSGVRDPRRLVRAWAHELDATPAQITLAWLLQRAPNIIPIPGTSTVRHLEENVAATGVLLPDAAMRELSAR